MSRLHLGLSWAFLLLALGLALAGCMPLLLQEGPVLPAEEGYTAADHNRLGAAFESQGEFKQAIRQYKLAVRKNPQMVVAYTNLGNVYLRQGSFWRASRYYQQALEVDPDYTVAMNNLAWLHIESGWDLPEAVRLLERALALKPADEMAYLDSLGWAYYKQGRYDEAVATLKQAIAKTPPEASFALAQEYDHLAAVYEAQGRKDEAARARARAQSVGAVPASPEGLPAWQVYFERGSVGLSTKAKAVLAQALDCLLKERPEARVLVAGYSDSTGPEEANLRVSRRRAEAVADFLVAGGLGRDRIEVAAFGEESPVASNQTEAGRARNRRVELRVAD